MPSDVDFDVDFDRDFDVDFDFDSDVDFAFDVDFDFWAWRAWRPNIAMKNIYM